MQVGIFTRTFNRPTLAEALDAVAAHGIGCVQLNLSAAPDSDMPATIDAELVEQVRVAHAERGIEIAAVSGTYNMIHPNQEVRAEGIRRLALLASVCAALGTDVITLCSGTRDPNSMWRRHPDNDTPEAWRDLLLAMAEVAAIGERHGVTMAFEPEVANVVDSARKARRLLDEIGSARLKVCMDGANIFHTGDLQRMDAVLDEAFELVGSDIALAHAKDLTRDGAAGNVAAGEGLLDYDRYVALLRASGFEGALVLHGLEERQVPACLAFLDGKLRRA